jgi:D-alanine-D-alanine ligase
MEQKRYRVGVLMGGISSERDISLASGQAVADALAQYGHDVHPIRVDDTSLVWDNSLEVAFIALHGRYGEDGAIQRYLESIQVPFTGSSSLSAECSFDKVRTRERLAQAGLPVPRGELIRQSQERTLSFPLVIKPPREGSSVGCAIVENEAGWEEAYCITSAVDHAVLVEEYIAGRELTVGIVGDEVLPIVEIVPTGTWFDFDAKYRSDQTRYEIPAQLDLQLTHAIKEMAKNVYDELGAAGCARVDFRLDESNHPFVLELNSIPGFTPKSLLPKAAAAAGISFPELCDRVVQEAINPS